MKISVVFYSYDGNCAFIARQIAKALKADLFQIQTVNERKPSGFTKYIWGGRQVVFNNLPALKPIDFDASAYDLIILGTPVWAFSPAPAMKSFLSKTKISGKKVALFMCHAGGPKKAMIKFKSMLADNNIVSEIDFNNPVLDAENSMQKTETWAKSLT